MRCDTGGVRCYADDGTTLRPLGPVLAGRSYVVEGPFRMVYMFASTGPVPQAASGEYEVRVPTTDPRDPDRFLGGGSLQLAPNTPYNVYGSFGQSGAAAPRARILTVGAQQIAGPDSRIEVTSVPAASEAYVVDGGDWGFCSRVASTFTMTAGAQNPTQPSVQYELHALPLATSKIEGDMSAQTDEDQDFVSVDGQTDLGITIKNNGQRPIRLQFAYEQGADQQETVQPGQESKAPAGKFSKFEWTYGQRDDAVHVTIRGT